MSNVVSIPVTPRLYFRPLEPDDAQLLFDLDQDPEVMRFLTGGIHTTWEEITELFIPRFMDFTDPARGCGIWMVFEKDSQEFMGWILARPYRFGYELCEADNIELGWRFKRKYWGKGIATEAATSVKKVIEVIPGVNKFSAIADPLNEASRAVMKKLGMHFVDYRIHHNPVDTFEVVYYEMVLCEGRS
jgi:RimJ/RimL family protein N-acetyltransferase